MFTAVLCNFTSCSSFIDQVSLPYVRTHYKMYLFSLSDLTTLIYQLISATISNVRKMQQKYRVKGKKPYFGFVDLEKAFDRVPREVYDGQCASWEWKNGWY